MILRIDKSYLRSRRMIEDSMKNLDPGSRAYLDRLIALSKLEQGWRDERFRRGLDPENLGAVTQVQYVFRATTELAPETRDAARRLLEEDYDRAYGFTYDGEDDEPEQLKKSRRKK
jgi:hypothetical protein